MTTKANLTFPIHFAEQKEEQTRWEMVSVFGGIAENDRERSKEKESKWLKRKGIGFPRAFVTKWDGNNMEPTMKLIASAIRQRLTVRKGGRQGATERPCDLKKG